MPYQARARIVRPDGTGLDAIIQGFPEIGPDGTLIALHGMLLDVTDLVRSERRAHETDTLLRGTLDSMDQGLVVLDAAQRVRVFNRSAAELLDLPGDVLRVGVAFPDIHAYQRARGDFAAAESELRLGLIGRDPQALPPVFDWRLPSGVILEVRRSPLADGGAVLTFGDVTQNRIAERAMEESERRYRLLAENATDIIIWSDLTTCRRYVSPAVRAVLGYEPEALDRHAAPRLRPSRTTWPPIARVLDGLTSGRTARALTCQRYRHRNGHWVWLEISFSLTHDAGDRRAGRLRRHPARRERPQGRGGRAPPERGALPGPRGRAAPARLDRQHRDRRGDLRQPALRGLLRPDRPVAGGPDRPQPSRRRGADGAACGPRPGRAGAPTRSRGGCSGTTAPIAGTSSCSCRSGRARP